MPDERAPRPRRPRAPRVRGGTRRLRTALARTAAHRCCASSSTPRRSNCSADRWPTRSSRCCDPRLRALLAPRGPRRRRPRWGTHADRHLGARMRVHARHGDRIRRRGRARTSWSTDPRCAATPSLGRPVRDSDVVAFGRDLQVSYRVWSPKSGYPGHGAYRDFHTYDHDTGLKPARVTGRTVDSADKAPYDPDLAAAAVDRHVADFVATVRRTAARRVRAHRTARARRRRVRHRTVRALVARGSAVAREGAARAARGRRPGRHPRRRPPAGLRRRTRPARRLVVGIRQGLAGVGRRSGLGPGATQRRGRRDRARHRRQGPRRRCCPRTSRAPRTASTIRSCARHS